MKKNIFLINFWQNGGMKHYSDAINNILQNKYEVNYFNNSSKKSEINKKLPIKRPLAVHITSDHPKLLLSYPIFSKYNSIITLHDVKLHEGESLLKRGYHRIHLYFIYKYIKKVIVHSEKIKQDLPNCFKRKKVYVMPHANYNHLVNLIKVKKDKRLTLLFFGRILPYKGLKYLVEAFKELPKEKFKLIIAGEGKIDCKIPQNENIELINKFVSDEEMQILFSKSDVSILPYISATQSGVAYLSFAFNKPVIATNVGAISEIVKDNFNGSLIQPKSAEKIKKAIEKMTNKKYYERLVNNIKNQNESDSNLILKMLGEIYND